MKVLMIVSTLLFACYANAAVEIPSVSDVQQRIDSIEAELRDPTSVWGEGYYSLPEEDKAQLAGPWAERLELSLKFQKAWMQLLQAQGAEFNDTVTQLMDSLEATKLPEDAVESLKQSVAQMLVFAVESELISISPEQFERVLSGLDSKNTTKWPHVFNPPDAKVSLAYLRGDVKMIVKMLNKITNDLDRGYAELRLAQLAGTQEQFERAIGTLQSVFSVENGQSKGRIALYLARSWLLQTQSDRKSESLEQAFRFAKIARMELEYMDAPLFWAAAHRVSGQILEEARSRLDAELEPLKIVELDYKIQRAYELGMK